MSDDRRIEIVARAMMDHALWKGTYDRLQTWQGSDVKRDIMKERARAVLAALDADEQESGLVSVPREPTDAMFQAGMRCLAGGVCEA